MGLVAVTAVATGFVGVAVGVEAGSVDARAGSLDWGSLEEGSVAERGGVEPMRRGDMGGSSEGRWKGQYSDGLSHCSRRAMPMSNDVANASLWFQGVGGRHLASDTRALVTADTRARTTVIRTSRTTRMRPPCPLQRREVGDFSLLVRRARTGGAGASGSLSGSAVSSTWYDSR
ncbi:hypothetical protein MXAN_5286 [Myxococcus xanthus DK 1622]|uniref:Uncharacterized protein n=1 Tax=Myxococcus xanthus (strain DK1622) TaxID=246197 RepID=Q1D1N5_MYXXD|nr:hypothetical protein MXAN_5286 [Myxococcus xanthus DK 1622]